ncbi:putative hydrolase YdeN [bacterium BMS3Abin15]|nr:putative hydrolase YdeN [bacterium BMS3Abin15]HDH07495.1 serine hydrolase family protein [Candidatus Moranbacteria bacterium]HDZ84934.1 serine hydrolase family protein [Candidatus Moranbacteria bacterium]
MKKVVVIHCWEGYPEYCWYPYVKKTLEKKGYEVNVPAFPETDLPKLDKWLPKLQEAVGQPSENVILVGHSVGCITILRYLESLSEDQKIGGAILVAGYIGDLGYDELKNFFDSPVNFEKAKRHCENFIAIHSDNDPYVDLKHADIFKKELDAEIIIKHNAKHFSGPSDKEDSCTELPDVVDSIEKL